MLREASRVDNDGERCAHLDRDDTVDYVNLEIWF